MRGPSVEVPTSVDMEFVTATNHLMARMARLMIGLLSSAAILIPTRSPAQVVIPDAPSCVGCRIVAENLVTLASPDGPEALRALGQLSEDGLGRLWYGRSEGTPLVFESDGRFIRGIGKAGAGVGEFQMARPIIRLPGDSVLIFDGINGRATVVGPDLQTARFISVPFFVDDAEVLRWPDRLLVGSNIPSPALIGLPLHVVDMSGSRASIVSSSGLRGDPAIDVLGTTIVPHRVSSSRREGVWVMNPYVYNLQLRDVEMSIVGEWTRVAPWFDVEAAPVQPIIAGVHEDDLGRLWVVLHTPRPEAGRIWRDHFARTFPNGVGRTQGQFVEIDTADLPPAHTIYNTTVEVIDTASGRVLARSTIDAFLIGLMDGPRAAAYYEDAFGIPRISLMSLVLRE